MGKVSDLYTPHQEYLHLEKDASDRQRIYCEFVSHHVDGELLQEIRDKTHKVMVVGDDRFKEELGKLTGRRLKSKKKGPSSRMAKGKDLISLCPLLRPEEECAAVECTTAHIQKSLELSCFIQGINNAFVRNNNEGGPCN